MGRTAGICAARTGGDRSGTRRCCWSISNRHGSPGRRAVRRAGLCQTEPPEAIVRADVGRALSPGAGPDAWRAPSPKKPAAPARVSASNSCLPCSRLREEGGAGRRFSGLQVTRLGGFARSLPASRTALVGQDAQVGTPVACRARPVGREGRCATRAASRETAGDTGRRLLAACAAIRPGQSKGLSGRDGAPGSRSPPKPQPVHAAAPSWRGVARVFGLYS